MPVRFEFQQEKALAAIEFLVQQGIRDLTKGKIDKLLFLADKHHLVQFGRPITGDWYVAAPHGPMPSSTDNLLDAFEEGRASHPCFAALHERIELDRQHQYPHFRCKDGAPSLASSLSRSDIDSLQATVEKYGSRTFTELRALTHEMPAYERAWEARSGQRGEMRFEDFFEEDSDAIAGVREEMIENCALRRAFPEPVF